MNKYSVIHLWCGSESSTPKYLLIYLIFRNTFFFSLHFMCLFGTVNKILPLWSWTNANFTFLTEENSRSKNMMNVEIRKHGMYSQYILLCGFFLSVEFFDMFKDINNLERKKIVTEVLEMSISNMLTCWASAGAELQLSKRWLMEILNFCKIFVLILVKIETH